MMDIETRIQNLESENRKLRWSMRVTTAVGVMAMCLFALTAASPPEQNSISLTSPNGQYRILLRATNTCAGIWISGDQTGSMVALVNDEKKGSVVGVYGPKLNGETWKSLDAAMSASKDGGYFMLANPDQSDHKFITGK